MPTPLTALTTALRLVAPDAAHRARYIAALQAGWSADHLRGRVAADEEIQQLTEDPASYEAKSDDRIGHGTVTLPDGSQAQRLPWMRRWIFVGEDCAGTINLRWVHGSPELPPHVLGHIGYGVVPWMRGRGVAQAALAAMLLEARALALPWVELTTDEDNHASQRVILANGGHLVERFTKPAAFGSVPSLRFRIPLGAAA